MLKSDELANPDSCLSRARPDEYVFVLLARDESAPGAIRWWIADRILRGKNKPGDAQIAEAERAARAIEERHAAIARAVEHAVMCERARCANIARRRSEYHAEHCPQSCQCANGYHIAVAIESGLPSEKSS